jgi:hypothetical protein
MAKISNTTKDELIELTIKELSKGKSKSENTKDEMIELALKEAELHKSELQNKKPADRTKDEMIELALNEADIKKPAERTKDEMVELAMKEAEKIDNSLDKKVENTEVTMQDVLSERDKELKKLYKGLKIAMMNAAKRPVEQQEEQRVSQEREFASANDVKRLNEVVKSATDWTRKMGPKDMSKAGADYAKDQQKYKGMTKTNAFTRIKKDDYIIEKEMEFVGSHFGDKYK